MKKIKIAFMALGIALCTFVAAQELKPLDAYLTTINYPYPENYIKFESQGQNLEMVYMDVKPVTANGRTIVLLHGKNFNAAYWKKTAEVLLKEGFRVIMPDQIGFGKSSKPHDYQFSFSQLAYNTKLILDKLKIDKAIILGHSMGGMVATRFTLQYPERVEKLVLENPIGLEDYKTFAGYETIDEAYKGN